MTDSLEEPACTPYPVNPDGFNPKVELPYGLKNEHIFSAMLDFTNF